MVCFVARELGSIEAESLSGCSALFPIISFPDVLFNHFHSSPMRALCQPPVHRSHGELNIGVSTL